MKSSVIALMALAVVGFSGAAFAGQAAMTDAEMDKVTAGAAGGQGNTFGADRAAEVQLSRTDVNGPSGGNKAFGQSQGGGKP